MVQGRLRAPLLALALGVAGCDASAPDPVRVTAAEDALLRQVHGWIESGELARGDGFVYAIDLGQLLLYAARSGDEALYAPLRDLCLAHLVLDDPADPFTRGMVLWRYDPTGATPPDASGTTEALRVAEGLWRGGDRDTAARILDAYARHAAVDNGVWIVRNYFNLGTRTFATNSFLVDYAPDFVAEVAADTDDPDLAEIAQRSYALLDRAQTPAGLVHDVVQPELATINDASLVVFSPNDQVRLGNAATVAEQCIAGRPHLAVGVLGFATARLPRLHAAYYGRTGEPALETWPGLGARAALLRLALHLEDDAAVAALLPAVLDAAEGAARSTPEPRLYVAGELLLALEHASRD